MHYFKRWQETFCPPCSSCILRQALRLFGPGAGRGRMEPLSSYGGGTLNFGTLVLRAGGRKTGAWLRPYSVQHYRIGFNVS